MIYFIQDKTFGNIKIGYSENVQKRFKALQTANAVELVLLGVIQGSVHEERSLHGKFMDYRLKGEWFAGSIFHEVTEIIAREVVSPLKVNVVVWTYNPPPVYPTCKRIQDASEYTRKIVEYKAAMVEYKKEIIEYNNKLVIQVPLALDALRVEMPIDYLLTWTYDWGERVAGTWAAKNGVKVHSPWPLSRPVKMLGKGIKLGKKMMNAQFDRKMLLVFSDTESSEFLMKHARKNDIPVRDCRIRKTGE